jgi:sugar phosphate isomerase/epimerase
MTDTHKVSCLSHSVSLFSVKGLTPNRFNQTLEGFFSSCAESGPEGCAFAHRSSTAKELAERLDGIYERLKERPLTVGSSEWGPGVVTASDVHYTVSSLSSSSASKGKHKELTGVSFL